jgi:hypothetical protein
MKFYKEYKNSYYYLDKVEYNKLDAIYFSGIENVLFFIEGKKHNNKNAALIHFSANKRFYLNGKLYGKVYGNQIDFDKKSWRKFVKLQAFL